MTHQFTLTFSTPGRGTRDITDDVTNAVKASGVQCGLAHVFVQHTSCSLTNTENADPDVRHDLETIMKRIVPDGDPAYRHQTEGPDDMAAHGRSVLTGSSLTVPADGGRLCLVHGKDILVGAPHVGAAASRGGDRSRFVGLFPYEHSTLAKSRQ